MSDDPAESVSAVNRALIAGLASEYDFIASATNRRFGTKRQARLNAWNLFYLIKHVAIWTFNLLRHRPHIAHYAINGGSALWKGLLFLRLARRFGARTIGHLHSGGFLDYWQSLSPERRRKAAAEFARFDAFVVLSESWRHAMATKVGVPPDLLYVVNNPIDAEFEDAASRMPLERSRPSLLGMGILSRDKGALDLIAALRLLRAKGVSPTLCLAGPEREPGIKSRIAAQLLESKMEGLVTLPGMIKGAAKIDVFRDCGISVLPSYYENFPLVLLEAAAAGHAIITTPVGAVPEFFNDGVSAIFVPPGDIQQLANAIETLVNNASERVRLAQAAHAMFIQRLARPEIMRSLQNVYRAVLSETADEPALHSIGARD